MNWRKNRLHDLLCLNGHHFKLETHYKTHWTLLHYAWLQRTIDSATGTFKIYLTLLVRQLKELYSILAQYDQEIEALAKASHYEPLVKALICYKGIKNVFAMTMVIEIEDIKRFPHLRQLMSWIGRQTSEQSESGVCSGNGWVCLGVFAKSRLTT